MRTATSLLLLTLLAGCAASGVERTMEDGESILRTRSIPISPEVAAGTQLRPAESPIEMYAISNCENSNCTEGGTHLILNARRTTDAQMNYLPVIMRVDGVQFEWPELGEGAQEQQRQMRGEFLRLAMDVTKFRRFAYGDDVLLLLGSNRFELTSGQRAPMRDLITELQGGVPSDSSD